MDPNNQGYGQAQGYYNGQQQYNNAPPQKQYQQYEQGPPPQQFQQQQYQQYDNGGPGPQEQMPNPPSYGQNYSSPDGKAGFEQTFKVERPKWNDLWAGALLIVVFLGYVAISGYCLHSYASNSSLNNGGFSNTDNTFGLNGNTLVLFAFVLVAALVLGYAYVVMARMFTKQFIWISGILNICMTIATAVYQFYRHAYVGGVLFALLAVFTIICFISWIKRIPFSVLMFQTAVDVSKKFGHVYLVSFMGGLIAALFAAWFAATLVAVYIRFQPSNNNPACAAGGSGGDCSKATVIGLVVYITFAGYWITEWLKNTIHVTISGVYGAWYFNPNNPAKGATRGAAKRALTYSFGSIAFGSLIVAILDFLRFACSIARGNGGTGNPVADCAFCILQCILGLIQWAIEFVNRYAFSYIALYGKAYIASAKGTWKMIKDRGIDALINECLVGPVLSMGCLFVAVCCALVAYIYLDVTDPAYNEGGAFTGVIVVYAFLIGLQIASCFVVPINSGIDTIFVGMGWDPQCLMQQHGDLYQRMVQVYPHVQQAIHA